MKNEKQLATSKQRLPTVAMVFFHWLLPTRWWDRIVRMMGKKKWM